MLLVLWLAGAACHTEHHGVMLLIASVASGVERLQNGEDTWMVDAHQSKVDVQWRQARVTKQRDGEITLTSLNLDVAGTLVFPNVF